MFLQPARGTILGPTGHPLMPTAATADNPVSKFFCEIKKDIYAYCDYLKFTPTYQQRELLDAMQGKEANIAVRSGQGTGKTTSAAVAISWWSLTNKDSLTVVTAPTMSQCRDVWLSETERLINGSEVIKPLFSFTRNGYGINGMRRDHWGAYVRTATKAENFQGIHNERLLIYCEEASGIPRPIMDVIKGTLSNAEGTFKWVMVGNPNTRTCFFYDAFHGLAYKPWLPLHWDAEKTPETKFFSKRRNEELADEFGKDSDVYRVRVKGEFPSLDPDSLISETDLRKCFTEEARVKAFAHADKANQIGLDLARFGGDENVLTMRAGRVLLKMEPKSRIDPNDMIDRAVFLQDQLQWDDKNCMYVVDTSGMGETAVGHIGGKRRLGKRVHEFYSQNTAKESRKYANKITEAWCHFARMVRNQEVYLGEKEDKKLILQLISRKYYMDNKNRIKIETKDEYKKRNSDSGDGDLGKSPDRADSIVMCFYPHASQSQRIAMGR